MPNMHLYTCISFPVSLILPPYFFFFFLPAALTYFTDSLLHFVAPPFGVLGHSIYSPRAHTYTIS